MRRLFALLALSLPASAQTGPPTPAELARATAECETEVATACLHTLMLESILQTRLPERGEPSSAIFLNRLAVSQVRSGDKAGALRTLGLTDPEFETLVQLGRWDEAWAKAQAILARGDQPYGSDLGGFKRRLVSGMLDQGETRLAFRTALSIPDPHLDDREKALLGVVRHATAAGDIATAIIAANRIREVDARNVDDRSEALQMIVEAQVKAGALADAEGLLDQDGLTVSSLHPRLILAKAWHEAGFIPKAQRQFDLVLDRATQDHRQRGALSLILIDSAGLAMALDMLPTARMHALAAFDQFDIPTLDVAKLDEPERQRLASILEYSGAEGKAAALRRIKRGRYEVSPDGRELVVLIEKIWGKLREDGTSSQAVLRDLRLLTVTFPPGSDPDRVAKAFQTLRNAGLEDEARKFATDVAALDDSKYDLLPLLDTLLVQDLSLVPDMLAASPRPWIKLNLSLIEARELAKAGRAVEARGLLQDLLAKMTPCRSLSTESVRTEGGASTDVIAVQAQLGFAEDASLARAECLAGILAEARDGREDYLRLNDLARTFPLQDGP